MTTQPAFICSACRTPVTDLSAMSCAQCGVDFAKVGPTPIGPPGYGAWQAVVPQRSGWTTRRKAAAGLLILVGLAFVAVVGARIAPIAPAAGGPPDIETIGFGTGVDNCVLAGDATTFAAGVPVMLDATFSPALPVGDRATIRVFLNGTELDSLRGMFTPTVPTACISGSIGRTPLPAGHYRVEVDLPVVRPAPDTEAQAAPEPRRHPHDSGRTKRLTSSGRGSSATVAAQGMLREDLMERARR
jgi:hypothetical protein